MMNIKKLFTVVILCLAAQAAVCFNFSRTPKPIKIGIVCLKSAEEEGYPYNFNTQKPAQWFADSLQEPQYKTTILAPEQLIDKSVLNAKNFDVLIFPYGASGVPMEIHEDTFMLLLASYMRDGSHVIIAGGGGYRKPYDAVKKIWLTPEDEKKLNKERGTGFGKWQSTFRFFDVREVLYPKNINAPVLNPKFRKLCPELPEKLETRNWPPVALGPGTNPGAGTGFHDDIIIPLYYIEAANQQGVTNKVSPIWIVRHHSARFNGSTMILNYYKRWSDNNSFADVFKRPDGDKILKSLISLCFRRLPGEKAKTYYEKKLCLKRNVVELERKYIALVHSITEAQQNALYQNKVDNVSKLLKVKQDLEKQMNEILSVKNKLLARNDTAEKEFSALIAKVKKTTRKIDKISASYPKKDESCPPTSFYFSIQGGRPDFALYYGYLKLAKEAGVNLVPHGYYYGFWSDAVRKRFGFGFYAGFAYGGHHRGISRVRCAIFDPKTGKNCENAVRKNWFYDEETFQQAMSSAEKNLQSLKDKKWVEMYQIANEMHIRWNQGWGERGMMLFRKYLAGKYGAIEKVNELWSTSYKDFSEIVIPVKAPTTQAEHAYWEDWAIFRDEFITRYGRAQYNMAKKYNPDKPVLSRYMGMNNQPIRANNFSILNKYSDINGTHSYWRSGLYTPDWLHRLGQKPFYNSEYTFHKYEKTGYVNYCKWLRRDLWHGISNGQIGFQLYPWYWAHVPMFENYSFLESDNTPRMVVWELKDFIGKSGKWSDIVRHGKSMEKARIAFLWSETSRRHQMGNKLYAISPIFAYADGINALFRNAHLEREVLSEPEIEAEGIQAPIKLLIIPGSIYFRPKAYAAMRKFVENGGWLFAINTQGEYYDNRGKEDFTIFELAGIVPQEIPSPRFLEYNDHIITDLPMIAKWYGWKKVTGEMETLVSTAEEYPVIVKTKKGKGGIILSSLPIGSMYSVLTRCGLLATAFPESALILQDIVKSTASSIGILPTAEANSLIEIHPWYYKGKKYLLVVNLYTKKEGVFPFSLPYEASEIYDIANEVSIPLAIKDGKTLFKLYLGKGDGMVLEVKK